MIGTKQLADQLHRAVNGNAWHGPSVLELLEGINSAKAFHHRLPDRHNIWEIVQHLDLYNGLLLSTVILGKAMPPEEASDWPEPPAQDLEGDWQRLTEHFRISSSAAVEAIRSFPDPRLTGTVPGRQYDFAFFLQGFVQHVLYHAGQIALLR